MLVEKFGLEFVPPLPTLLLVDSKLDKTLVQRVKFQYIYIYIFRSTLPFQVDSCASISVVTPQEE